MIFQEIKYLAICATFARVWMGNGMPKSIWHIPGLYLRPCVFSILHFGLFKAFTLFDL